MDYPDGATPLDPNELEGVKFPHIQTRSQLDQLEQQNIQEGLKWLARQIHLFPNGNGRHSRIMTDALLEKYLQESALQWNRETSAGNPEHREVYINALRRADAGDYIQLINFLTGQRTNTG